MAGEGAVAWGHRGAQPLTPPPPPYTTSMCTRGLRRPVCVSPPTDSLSAFKPKPCRAISRPQAALLLSSFLPASPSNFCSSFPTPLANSWLSLTSCCLPARAGWPCRRGAGCLVPSPSHGARLPGERGHQPWCTYPRPGPPGLQPPRTDAAGGGLQDPSPPTPAPCVGR